MRYIMYKIKVIIFIILFFGTIPVIHLQAQEKSGVKAIQLFDSGNYQDAEKLLQQLLEQNPNNPASQYYYGAARTENQHYGKAEINWLLSAGKDFTPDRLNYYLGIQYHALENWEQALKHYNLFRMSVPEAEQKAVGLAKKIQLCFNRENPFTGASPEVLADNPADEQENRPVHTSIKTAEDTSANDENDYPGNLSADNSGEVAMTDLFVPREALPNLPNVQTVLPDEEPVDFYVNNIITYQFASQFQTDEGRKLFEKAQSLKLDQENKVKELNKHREDYKVSRTNEFRQAVAAKILDLENELYRIEEEKVAAYMGARSVENEYWNNAGPVSRNNFLIEQEKILEALHKDESKSPVPNEVSLIDLVQPQPKAETKSKSDDLTYKIQIGAYSKGVPAYRQRIYNKLRVIRTIENYTDDKGVVVYTTGNLSRLEDALKMQSQVKQEGVEDAIVVPYFKGKRITLEQAKEIEAQDDV